MKVAFPFRTLSVGAVIGAILAMIVGFTWGGWSTASKSKAITEQRVSDAIVSVLAPICHANFQTAQDVDTQRSALKALNSWEREAFVKKAGWVDMPGVATKTASSTNSAVARACADLILAKQT